MYKYEEKLDQRRFVSHNHQTKALMLNQQSHHIPFFIILSQPYSVWFKPRTLGCVRLSQGVEPKFLNFEESNWFNPMEATDDLSSNPIFSLIGII